MDKGIFDANKLEAAFRESAIDALSNNTKTPTTKCKSAMIARTEAQILLKTLDAFKKEDAIVSEKGLALLASLTLKNALNTNNSNHLLSERESKLHILRQATTNYMNNCSSSASAITTISSSDESCHSTISNLSTDVILKDSNSITGRPYTPQNHDPTDSSTSSPTVTTNSIIPVAPGTIMNGNGHKGHFQIPSDILDDLASRFIINVPDIELSSLIRICFQIELAHWFYLDFFCVSEEEQRRANKVLLPCGIKSFATQLFQHIPFLRSHLPAVDSILEDWKNYKLSVPTYGAILLSEDLEHCLLVQSYFARCSWGFPKGKVNENEDPVHCATREVFEETGYDITNIIVPTDYVEAVLNLQYTRLYIVRDISMKTHFAPRTRNEIKCCEWFRIDSLPINRNDTMQKNKLGLSPNSFFMIIPFVKRLKRWIHDELNGVRRKKSTLDPNGGIGNNSSNGSALAIIPRNPSPGTPTSVMVSLYNNNCISNQKHHSMNSTNNSCNNTSNSKKYKQQQQQQTHLYNNTINNNDKIALCNGAANSLSLSTTPNQTLNTSSSTTAFETSLAVSQCGTNGANPSALSSSQTRSSSMVISKRSKRQRHKSMGDLDGMKVSNSGNATITTNDGCPTSITPSTATTNGSQGKCNGNSIGGNCKTQGSGNFKRNSGRNATGNGGQSAGSKTGGTNGNASQISFKRQLFHSFSQNGISQSEKSCNSFDNIRKEKQVKTPKAQKNCRIRAKSHSDKLCVQQQQQQQQQQPQQQSEQSPSPTSPSPQQQLQLQLQQINITNNNKIYFNNNICNQNNNKQQHRVQRQQSMIVTNSKFISKNSINQRQNAALVATTTTTTTTTTSTCVSNNGTTNNLTPPPMSGIELIALASAAANATSSISLPATPNVEVAIGSETLFLATVAANAIINSNEIGQTAALGFENGNSINNIVQKHLNNATDIEIIPTATISSSSTSSLSSSSSSSSSASSSASATSISCIAQKPRPLSATYIAAAAAPVSAPASAPASAVVISPNTSPSTLQPIPIPIPIPIPTPTPTIGTLMETQQIEESNMMLQSGVASENEVRGLLQRANSYQPKQSKQYDDELIRMHQEQQQHQIVQKRQQQEEEEEEEQLQPPQEELSQQQQQQQQQQQLQARFTPNLNSWRNFSFTKNFIANVFC